MKKCNSALAVLMMGAIFTSAFADENKPTNIYPFVPMTVAEIYSDVERVTEDKDFIRNFNDIIDQKLSKRKTTVKPWSSSYWPLGKGTIADPYENSKVVYYVDYLRTHKGLWKNSIKSFEKRKTKVLNESIYQQSNKELSELAPSEKYDLLLGDLSFDLTTRQMDYMNRYGSNNYYGSLSKITVAAEDTADQAQKYVQWGWYESIEDALRVDIVLSKRLETQRAIELLDSGDVSDPLKAIEIVTPQALEDAKNYVISERLATDIAGWEGICNGWSTAAGIIPRPKKSVSFTLGQRTDGSDIVLKFYPDDIKGLVSQFWFNSLIQNTAQKDDSGNLTGGGTILVGNRCNTDPEEDEYGRLYDVEVDPYSRKLESRCAGVHPAKWHLGLVNIIGKQGRSFIVERKVESPVDNHPMYRYEMKYFNPKDGLEYESLKHNIEQVDQDDQFAANRNPKAKYIVGVETTMVYLNYMKPKRDDKNTEKDDSEVDKTMLYDLELDADYNIVGGQWRAKYAGKILRVRKPGQKFKRKEKRNHNQPDFFWVVSKQWKKSGLFNDLSGLDKWDNVNAAPPKSWLESAKRAHAFTFKESTYFGNGKMCDVKNPETGDERTVWCELETNKPQPLANVVNKLIELSSGVPFSEVK